MGSSYLNFYCKKLKDPYYTVCNIEDKERGYKNKGGNLLFIDK